MHGGSSQSFPSTNSKYNLWYAQPLNTAHVCFCHDLLDIPNRTAFLEQTYKESSGFASVLAVIFLAF